MVEIISTTRCDLVKSSRAINQRQLVNIFFWVVLIMVTHKLALLFNFPSFLNTILTKWLQVPPMRYLKGVIFVSHTDPCFNICCTRKLMCGYAEDVDSGYINKKNSRNSFNFMSPNCYCPLIKLKHMYITVSLIHI